MKKRSLACLALVGVMSVGLVSNVTMAKYSKTFSGDTSIVAAKFVPNTNLDDMTFNVPVVQPGGEGKLSSFYVEKKETQVPVKNNITLTRKYNNELTPITYQLEKNIDGQWTRIGYFNFKENENSAVVSDNAIMDKDASYRVTWAWPWTEASEVDTALQGKTQYLNIAVTVNQVKENIVTKYVYVRDKSLKDTGKYTWSGSNGIVTDTELNTITIRNNEYLGDVVFEKQADGRYILKSSTLKPEYVGRSFGFTNNPNSYDYMLQFGGGNTEMVIEVGF